MLVIADDLLRRPGVEHRGPLELGDDALELLGEASGLAPLFPLALEALAKRPRDRARQALDREPRQITGQLIGLRTPCDTSF